MSVATDLADEGYAVLPGLIAEERCSAVRRSLDRGRTAASLRAGRVQDAWRSTPAVRELACEPAVLRLLTDVYGRRPIPFQTLNFARGTGQPLHQDLLHFDSIPTGLVCAVWVALEDVGESQGPLVVVPGSQRLTPPDPAQFQDRTGGFAMTSYEEAIASLVGTVPPHQVHLSCGDAVLWAAGLVHGGAPQTDPTVTRWSQVTHYFFERSVYLTPMRSNADRDHVQLRDPVFDIWTGRFVEHEGDDGPVRSTSTPGGGRRLLVRDEADPSPFAQLRSGGWRRAQQLRMRSAHSAHRAAGRARSLRASWSAGRSGRRSGT